MYLIASFGLIFLIFLDRDEATIQCMVAFLISLLKEIGSEIISCIQKIRIVIRFSVFNESFNYLTLLFFFDKLNGNFLFSL